MQTQPGYEFVETSVRAPRHEVPSAVPVFVGFTQSGSGTGQLQIVEEYADYLQIFGGPSQVLPGHRATRARLADTVEHYFANGGGTCFVLAVGAHEELFESTPGELVQRLSGPEVFAAIAREVDVSLLCVPDVSLFDDRDEAVDAELSALLAVWENAMAGCHSASRLFALLDPPAEFNAAKACVAWLNQRRIVGASHAAAWWPHLQVVSRTDPLQRGQISTVPPCGAVAAQIQATDRDFGVWNAPANSYPLTNVVQAQYPASLGEALFDDQLASINLIRSFPGRGVRLWGCRTLASLEVGDVGSYVQTRRLASWIQFNLAARARYSVFEPNNEITWLKLKAGFALWLNRLWEAGALIGYREEEAFKVVIGVGQSMTEDDIAQGLLLVEVYVAMHYPAEFIQLTVRLDMRDSLDALSPAQRVTRRVI